MCTRSRLPAAFFFNALKSFTLTTTSYSSPITLLWTVKTSKNTEWHGVYNSQLNEYWSFSNKCGLDGTQKVFNSVHHLARLKNWFLDHDFTLSFYDTELVNAAEEAEKSNAPNESLDYWKRIAGKAAAHTVVGLCLLGTSVACPPLIAAWWVHLVAAVGDTFRNE